MLNYILDKYTDIDINDTIEVRDNYNLHKIRTTLKRKRRKTKRLKRKSRGNKTKKRRRESRKRTRKKIRIHLKVCYKKSKHY